MTHTVATMEVSAVAFDEIAAKLREAGYDHAFLRIKQDGGAAIIDMHGIGLLRRPAAPANESAHVIVRQDDTGVLAYWTGKGEWAFSVENTDAIRFALHEDAQTVLDKVVKPSEGATFYHAKYPDDHLRVEEHMWSEVPKA